MDADRRPPTSHSVVTLDSPPFFSKVHLILMMKSIHFQFNAVHFHVRQVQYLAVAFCLTKVHSSGLFSPVHQSTNLIPKLFIPDLDYYRRKTEGLQRLADKFLHMYVCPFQILCMWCILTGCM